MTTVQIVPRRGPVAAGRKFLRTNAVVALAAIFLLCIVVAALFAPLLAPHDPNAVDLVNAYAAPSATHPLGTDDSGRDLLSRLLYGARPSLLGPAVVTVLSLLMGSVLAIVAAWRGGWADALISRVMDIAFAFPGLILAVISSAMFGPGLVAPVVALSIGFTPVAARVVRSVALRERNLAYVAALQVQGASPLRICMRHVLPNLVPLLVVQGGVAYAYAMLDLAAISYLGLGMQPPDADWGLMITNGQASILEGFPQQSLFAALAVLLTVVSLNVITGWLADRFDVEDVR